MNVSDEIRRIDNGPAADEAPGGIGVLNFSGVCQGDALEVAQRICEVLRAVLQMRAGAPPTESDWLSPLPEWLKEKFAPAMSYVEAERWLARWRSMAPDERATAEDGADWALEDWLHWFQSDERQWEFWVCRAIDGDTVRLSISVQRWPVAHVALDWLIRAAGAESIVEEESAT